MPWTYEDPPAVAASWTEAEQRRCVDAANAVLEQGGDDEEAIYACIAAAGKEGQMKSKTYPVKFKALDETDGQGTFEAIVAAFGNVDRVGDKIVPGAFEKSLADWEERRRPIPVIFSHDWGNLDAHIGEVLHAEERFQGLYVKARLDVDEPFAKKVWKLMKTGRIADFSFAYEEKDTKWVEGVHELRELEILEVGPTLVGANPMTQLLGIKAALPTHSTETTDAGWDGPGNEAKVKSDESVAYYRRIYAWQDPDGDEAVTSTYKFIHHMVDGDGNPGAANIRACQTGIGVLNGGRGGTTIPDGDRRGVWTHLARHLGDADLEPAELKGLKYGARHTAGEYEMLQTVHDVAVELGAKCPGSDADRERSDGGDSEGDKGQGGDGTPESGADITPRTSRRSLLAARVVFGELALDRK